MLPLSAHSFFRVRPRTHRQVSAASSRFRLGFRNSQKPRSLSSYFSELTQSVPHPWQRPAPLKRVHRRLRLFQRRSGLPSPPWYRHLCRESPESPCCGGISCHSRSKFHLQGLLPPGFLPDHGLQSHGLPLLFLDISDKHECRPLHRRFLPPPRRSTGSFSAFSFDWLVFIIFCIFRIFTIVSVIVAAASHVHAVQHRAEDPAAGPLQLSFGFLHQTIAECTALN